jgi:DNA (cytosine-5)-methyltransferase 1
VKAVDLFAGLGGFSLGAELAGAHVVWAANHWPLAVAAHAANHPKTAHACQDLRQADWTALPRFDVLLASPACQGHSQASQPRRRLYHDAMRSTAWSVVDCADVTNPRALLVENVLDFRRWRLYPEWRAALERLGYKLTEHVIVASEHGVPQRRTRLFIAGTKRRKFVCPSPLLTREPAFAPCIENDAPGWRPVSRAAPGARVRIEAGRRLGRSYLVQHTTGHRGVSLDEPIRTITTKDQWAIVNDDVYRPLTLRELARGMGFPDSYRWPDGIARADVAKLLGNAVCPPVARDLVTRLMEAA